MNEYRLKKYRVWTEGEKPEDGETVRAETSFEARQSQASLLGVRVHTVMARRIY